jgi:micrococcal nuclease
MGRPVQLVSFRRHRPVVGWATLALAMLFLFLVTLLWLRGGGAGAIDPLAAGQRSQVATLWQSTTPAAADAADGDQLSARFSFCHSGGGTNCVVDGDTFWFAGEKIRIADIDTPETHGPDCAAEAALGAEATQRLHALLSAGPFSLESGGRDTDRYGRKLRIVTRDGASLGAQLVDEGLARRWDGARRPWC